MENETQHTLTLTDRSELSLTGINDVDAFNEQEIIAVCDTGELVIKGELLHIEELSLESGIMTVKGKITSLSYNEKFTKSSVLKRLFGG
ncbi:MAG: YabP/YqfC family sporulation protein [Eubacterium sp.]|nr:YabP/YqfC family sporulation protein [Eubacterium sp.]